MAHRIESRAHEAHGNAMVAICEDDPTVGMKHLSPGNKDHNLPVQQYYRLQIYLA